MVLDGYKTYIAAGGLFLFALVGLLTSKLDSAQAIQILLNALGLFGLRNAIK